MLCHEMVDSQPGHSSALTHNSIARQMRTGKIAEKLLRACWRELRHPVCSASAIGLGRESLRCTHDTVRRQ